MQQKHGHYVPTPSPWSQVGQHFQYFFLSSNSLFSGDWRSQANFSCEVSNLIIFAKFDFFSPVLHLTLSVNK